MKKATNESVIIARHINAFLNEYVPSQKSRSSHTLKSYQYALSLYSILKFLSKSNKKVGGSVKQ